MKKGAQWQITLLGVETRTSFAFGEGACFYFFYCPNCGQEESMPPLGLGGSDVLGHQFSPQGPPAVWTECHWHIFLRNKRPLFRFSACCCWLSSGCLFQLGLCPSCVQTMPWLDGTWRWLLWVTGVLWIKIGKMAALEINMVSFPRHSLAAMRASHLS